MSNFREKQSFNTPPESADNSVSGSDWDMASDVFVSCYEQPMGDAIHGGMDSVQPGMDRHLPLLNRRGLSQDGMILGLEEAYTDYHARLSSDPGTAYLEISGDPNYSESDGNLTTKKRNRSNSSRHRGEVVTELGPEELRWFYKEDKRTWKPFVGHDSLKIEVAYRKFCELNPDKVRRRGPSESEDVSGSTGGSEPAGGETERRSSDADRQPVRDRGDSVCSTVELDTIDVDVDVDAVCVRGGLYEVDIKEKECYPVYWNRKYGPQGL